MANLNKVMLIGRLGQDPEIRYTQSGSAVANVTIATNDYWTDKQGGKQERTEWHSLVLWGKLADLAQSYLKVHKFMLKDVYRQETGKINRGRSITKQKLSSQPCSFLIQKCLTAAVTQNIQQHRLLRNPILLQLHPLKLT